MVSRGRRSEFVGHLCEWHIFIRCATHEIGMTVFSERSLMEKREFGFLSSISTTRERLYTASAQHLPSFSFVHSATCA